MNRLKCFEGLDFEDLDIEDLDFEAPNDARKFYVGLRDF